MERPGNISLKELAKRTPFIAGVFALGVTSVEAVGKNCDTTQLDLVGVGYLNNPLVANRPLQPDLVDIIVRPAPDFGPVVITWPDDVKNPTSPQHELRGFLADRGDWRDVLFKFPAGTLSNTKDNNGNEALEVQYYFEKDKPELNKTTGKTEQPRESVLIRCAYTAPALGGRRPPLSELEKILNDQNYQFRTIASVVNESMKNFTGQSADLKPETVDQKEIRRALQAFYDAEKQKATNVGSSSNPGASSVVITPPLPSLDSQPNTAPAVSPVVPPVVPGTLPSSELINDRNWWLIPAGLLAAAGLLALALVGRRRGWWTRTNTTEEMEITPPPLKIKVNLAATKPAPINIDIKYPQPQVTIRKTPVKK